MKIEKVSVSLSAKLSVQYQSIGVSISAEAQLEENENFEAVSQALADRIRISLENEIDKQVQFILSKKDEIGGSYGY